MTDLTRRSFGKMSIGALGVMTAEPGATRAADSPAASQSPKRMTTVMREMIKTPGVIAAPGIYDAITARIAEQLGFRALDLPGSALGLATCKIEPNLCLEDMVQATRAITSAVNLPLVVDVGAGFGEPAHIVHTVRALESAGAAGIHLEDQFYPKRFHYHVGQEHTISADTMLEKIRYAVGARRDPDFIIVGRTDAIRTVGFAEGVRRANLFLEAGADMVMPSHAGNDDQVRQLPKEVHGPINWTQSSGAPGEPRPFSLQELEAFGGYKLVNYVGGPILAAYKAVKDVLAQLKQTGSTGMDPKVWVPINNEVQELCGLSEYIRIENETVEKT